MKLAADDGPHGSGVRRTEYSLDDGFTWTSYTGADISVDGPGVISVQYRSADVAGNTELAGSSSLSIDAEDPIVTIDGVSEGARVQEVLVSFDAVDPQPGSGLAGVEAQLDGVPIANGALVMVEGPHLLEVQAEDAAGRIGRSSVSFTVDRSAPRVRITGPLDGSIGAGNVAVGFSVEDDGSGASWTSSHTNGQILADEGGHTLVVEAWDSLGNRAVASAFTVIDRTAPGVTRQISGTPGSDGWWVSAVDVALNAEDPTPFGVAFRRTMDERVVSIVFHYFRVAGKCVVIQAKA